MDFLTVSHYRKLVSRVCLNELRALVREGYPIRLDLEPFPIEKWNRYDPLRFNYQSKSDLTRWHDLKLEELDELVGFLAEPNDQKQLLWFISINILENGYPVLISLPDLWPLFSKYNFPAYQFLNIFNLFKETYHGHERFVRDKLIKSFEQFAAHPSVTLDDLVLLPFCLPEAYYSEKRIKLPRGKKTWTEVYLEVCSSPRWLETRSSDLSNYEDRSTYDDRTIMSSFLDYLEGKFSSYRTNSPFGLAELKIIWSSYENVYPNRKESYLKFLLEHRLIAPEAYPFVIQISPRVYLRIFGTSTLDPETKVKLFEEGEPSWFTSHEDIYSATVATLKKGLVPNLSRNLFLRSPDESQKLVLLTTRPEQLEALLRPVRFQIVSVQHPFPRLNHILVRHQEEVKKQFKLVRYLKLIWSYFYYWYLG